MSNKKFKQHVQHKKINNSKSNVQYTSKLKYIGSVKNEKNWVRKTRSKISVNSKKNSKSKKKNQSKALNLASGHLLANKKAKYACCVLGTISLKS